MGLVRAVRDHAQVTYASQAGRHVAQPGLARRQLACPRARHPTHVFFLQSSHANRAVAGNPSRYGEHGAQDAIDTLWLPRSVGLMDTGLAHSNMRGRSTYAAHSSMGWRCGRIRVRTSIDSGCLGQTIRMAGCLYRGCLAPTWAPGTLGAGYRTSIRPSCITYCASRAVRKLPIHLFLVACICSCSARFGAVRTLTCTHIVGAHALNACMLLRSAKWVTRRRRVRARSRSQQAIGRCDVVPRLCLTRLSHWPAGW